MNKERRTRKREKFLMKISEIEGERRRRRRRGWVMMGREGIDLILNVRITMMFTWKLGN